MAEDRAAKSGGGSDLIVPAGSSAVATDFVAFVSKPHTSVLGCAEDRLLSDSV